MRPINHLEANGLNGARTNWAESYFRRRCLAWSKWPQDFSHNIAVSFQADFLESDFTFSV